MRMPKKMKKQKSVVKLGQRKMVSPGSKTKTSSSEYPIKSKRMGDVEPK